MHKLTKFAVGKRLVYVPPYFGNLFYHPFSESGCITLTGFKVGFLAN